MQCNTKRLLQKVRETIMRHAMIEPKDHILLGLSGGMDSVCLLDVLQNLQQTMDFAFTAIHVEHGIRGQEAERDAEFVKKLCKVRGIHLIQRSVDVPTLARDEKVSIETAARLARYRCFHEEGERIGATRIATAHHLNDQAETVLMRILRGAGTQGLCGIRHVRADGVIRPLLDVSREEVEAYCGENALEYCTDSTNLADDCTRNKIRHHLLPMLEREWNPNVLHALGNLADHIAEDQDFIDGYAQRLYRRIGNPSPKKKPVLLDIETLRMTEPAIRTRLIRTAVREVMGSAYTMSRCHMDAIGELLKKETGSETVLPQGLRVSVCYGWLHFEKTDPKAKELSCETSHRIEAVIGETYQLGAWQITLSEAVNHEKRSQNQMLVYINEDLDQPLVLRFRQSGDRIAIYQDGREKKLKDWMIDQKIPRTLRDRIPLLCKGEQILAVIGARVAEPYKSNQKNTKGLVITYDTKDEGWQDYADRKGN